MRIEYNQMKNKLKEELLKCGTQEDLAERAAVILTDNTCDGIASHGINRFHRIMEYIENGYIKVNERPEIVSSFGAVEVIDGKLGIGMTNAYFAMDRAIKLAKENGIGCVALKNTNHWMRGASYGIQAANVGMIGICFTNTIPNMPAWGAKDSRIGNNPLVIAVPNKEGNIVLDMAMSQFSYGKMESLVLSGKNLPMNGGYNNAGELTNNPKEILESGRILPTGYWKGSGLSIVLDLLATVLSGGLSTKELGDQGVEYSASQVFIAINPNNFNDAKLIEDKVKATLNHIKESETVDGYNEIYYPGQRSALRRKDNLENGIIVNEKVWESILRM